MVHFPSNITWPEIERTFTLPPEHPRLTQRGPDGFEILTQLLPTAPDDVRDIALALAFRACQLEDRLENCVEVVRCKDCIHRSSTIHCPMCHDEYTWDEDDGGDYYTVDNTTDDSFCHCGEAYKEEEE